ncbi:MAG: hypothetical protein HQ581_11190, partial [Planctomycetes bacterium]|nr:hypothetical protein [Planctomycetota bacterium]
MRLVCCAIAIFVCVATAVPCFGQQPQRPYRLESVDLKQPVIWGAEVRGPEDG